LDAGYCGITDIAFLADLTGMQQLVLEGNPFSDITVLKDLQQLAHVNLDSTNVKDITPLADNPGIGSGDTVFVQQMSFQDCTAHLAAAQALKDRGVTLLAQCP
jgi:Leucine-rich repeat (LRR) protein